MQQFFFEHRLVWVSKPPNKDEQNASASRNIAENLPQAQKPSLRPILKNTDLIHERIKAVTMLITGKSEVSEKEVQEILGKISENTKRSIERGGLSTAEMLKRKVVNELARGILAEHSVDPNLIDIIENDQKMQSSQLYADLVRGYKKEKGEKAVQKIIEKAGRMAMKNMKIPKTYQDYVLKKPHLLKKIIDSYQEFYYSELNKTQKFDIKISWELELAETKELLAKCRNDEERAKILNQADRSLINTGKLSMEKMLTLDPNEQKKVIDSLVEAEVTKHKQQKDTIIATVKKEVKNSYQEDAICHMCDIDQEFFLPGFNAHLPEDAAAFFSESKKILQQKLSPKEQKSAIMALWHATRNSIATSQLAFLQTEYKDDSEYFASLKEHWHNLQDESFNEEDRNSGLMRLIEEGAQRKFLKQHPEFAEAQKKAIEEGEILDRPTEAKKVTSEIDEHLEKICTEKIVENLSKKKTSPADLQEALGLLLSKNMLKLVSSAEFHVHSKGVAKRPAYYDIDQGMIVINQDDPLVLAVLKKIESPSSTVDLKGIKDPINFFGSLLLHEVTHHRVAEHYGYHDAFLERAQEAFAPYKAATSPEKLRALLIKLSQNPESEILNIRQIAILKEFETKYQNDIRGQCYKPDGSLEKKYRDHFEQAIQLWPEKKFDLSKTGVERIIDELEACAAEYQKGTVKLEPPEVESLVKNWTTLRIKQLQNFADFNDQLQKTKKGIAASPNASENEEKQDSKNEKEEEIGIQTKAVNPGTLKAQLKDAIEKEEGKALVILYDYANITNDKTMEDWIKNEIEDNIKHHVEYIDRNESNPGEISKSQYQAQLIRVREWLGEVQGYARQAKGLIEAIKEETPAGLFESLWKNTRFLSIYDIKQMYTHIKEWVERRLKSKSQMKVGSLGSNLFKDIPFLSGLAQEFKRTDQAAQNSEVDTYEQSFKEYDLDDLYEEARYPKNQNSLKAAYKVLVGMGMMHGLLNDNAAWKTLAKYADMSVYSKDKALEAMDKIWGRPTGSNWLMEDSSNLNSKASSQVNILKGNPNLVPKYKKWIKEAQAKKDQQGSTTRIFNVPEIMGHVRADIEYGVTPVDELIPLVMQMILEGVIPDYAVSTMVADLMNKAPIHAVVSLSDAKDLGIYKLWYSHDKENNIIMKDGVPQYNKDDREKVMEFFAGKRLLPLPFNPDTASPDKVVIADKTHMVSVGQLLARRSRSNMTAEAIKGVDSSQVPYYTPYLSWNLFDSTYNSTLADKTRGLKANAAAAAVKGPIAEIHAQLQSADKLSEARLKYNLKEQMRRLLTLLEYFKRHQNRPAEHVAGLKSIDEIQKIPTDYANHFISYTKEDTQKVKGMGAMQATTSAWNQEALLEQNIVTYASKLQDTLNKIAKQNNIPPEEALDIMQIIEDTSSESPIKEYYVKSMKFIDKYAAKICKQ